MSLLCLSALAVMVAAAGTVEVRSGTDCPSSQQISTKLRPLLSSGKSLGPGGDVASVESVAADADGVAGFHLRLLRPDGTVVGDRRLDAQGDCEKKAEVIATVIAAWEIELDPIEPPPRFGVTLGASAGAALIGGISATGNVEMLLGPVRSWWWWRLAGMAERARERSLAGGTVSWQHTTMAGSVMLRSRGPSWRLAVDAGPILGWASLAGHGNDYWQGGRKDVLEYGGSGGFRLERLWSRVGLWLEWRTNVWTDNQQAILEGADPEAHATLSRFDMMVSLGGSMAVYP
jgi:hypothetical protein